MNLFPHGWTEARLDEIVGKGGLFVDGDWVETKDQDPSGDVRLTQLADVGEGFWRNRSHRYLTSASAHRLGCTYLTAGDILVARMPEPLGRACIYPGGERPAVTAVDVCILRPQESAVDRHWLMWMLNAPQVRAQEVALERGSTRKRISRKNLATVRLAVPPLDEQRRIVEAIEEQFSRLDRGLDTVGAARQRVSRFQHHLMETALTRMSPQQQPLKEFLREPLANGRSVPDAEPGSQGFPVLRLTCVRDGRIDVTQVKLGAWLWEDARKHVISSGDFLIVRGNGSRDLVGRGGLVTKATKVAYPDTLIRARVTEQIRPEYLGLVWNSRSVRDQIESAARTTAGIYKVNQSILNEIRIPMVSITDQGRLVDLLEDIQVLVRSASDSLARAANASRRLRQAILSAAFSGRLDAQGWAGRFSPPVSAVDWTTLDEEPLVAAGVPV